MEEWPSRAAEIHHNKMHASSQPTTTTSLPGTKTSHLKIDGWKTSFLLGFGLFSGRTMLVSERVAKKKAGTQLVLIIISGRELS